MDAAELEARVAEFLDRREHEPDLDPATFAGGDAALARAVEAALEVDALLRGEPADLPAHVGAYRVRARLGTGGMGVVYAVERDGARCALKRLAPALAGTPGAVARFEREVRALKRLAHPGIVRILDHGTHEGTPFLVMEELEGTGLDRLELPFSPDRAARVVLALAEAVQAAHEAGVLHRDLKPSNVVLRPGDVPVLIDFGLGAAEDEATLTASGALLGTPRYMAPEQARGVPADARTDVHGLGLVLFELLHGCPARAEGSREQVLERARRGTLVRPPEHRPVPRDLDRLARAALAREPRRRPASAARFAEELRRYLEGRPVRARPPGPLARSLDAVRRAPLRTAAGLGLAVLAGTVLVTRRSGQEAARAAHVDAALCAWLEGNEALARLELERARSLAPADDEVAALADGLWSDSPVPARASPLARGALLLARGDPSAARVALADAARTSGAAAALDARARADAGDRAGALGAVQAAGFRGSAAFVAVEARLLEEEGRPAEALAVLAEATRAPSAAPPLLSARARLALASGDLEGAVACALRATEGLEAAGEDASVELPRLLSLAQPTDELLAALARPGEGGRRGALLAFARGYALDSVHRLEEAAAAYVEALAQDPGLLRAHLNLAHLHAGAQVGACPACDQAFARAPAMRDPARALAHLEAALVLDGGASEACVGRIVQTTLTLAGRSPEAHARTRVAAALEGLLAREGLRPGPRRRIEEGLARLREAEH